MLVSPIYIYRDVSKGNPHMKYTVYNGTLPFQYSFSFCKGLFTHNVLARVCYYHLYLMCSFHCHQNNGETRMHSSRMRTARSLTMGCVPAQVLPRPPVDRILDTRYWKYYLAPTSLRAVKIGPSPILSVIHTLTIGTMVNFSGGNNGQAQKHYLHTDLKKTNS